MTDDIAYELLVALADRWEDFAAQREEMRRIAREDGDAYLFGEHRSKAEAYRACAADLRQTLSTLVGMGRL